MQCRELCEKATKARDKVIAQIEKLKEQKLDLTAEKKVAKQSVDAELNKDQTEIEKRKGTLKALEQKLKKNKDAAETAKKKAFDIGEQLLVDLVATIEGKGNMNKLIKTLNGYEAGPAGQFSFGSGSSSHSKIVILVWSKIQNIYI